MQRILLYYTDYEVVLKHYPKIDMIFNYFRKDGYGNNEVLVCIGIHFAVIADTIKKL